LPNFLLIYFFLQNPAPKVVIHLIFLFSPSHEDMAEQQGRRLEVDDNDSTVGDEIDSDDDSLASSVLAYPDEQGRRYHAYKPGTYYLPNDETEQKRLDL